MRVAPCCGHFLFIGFYAESCRLPEDIVSLAGFFFIIFINYEHPCLLYLAYSLCYYL